MLDIKSVIPEVVATETLELKYDRIKKIREEFNEIKTQFKAAVASLPQKKLKPSAAPQSSLRASLNLGSVSAAPK